jgi:DinB family protein
MNVRDAVKLSIDTGSMVSMAYLEDLSDQDLLRRPCPGCNHINWQIGHLISSEHQMGNVMNPGSMPDLPAGFEARYSKETATIDDPAKFCTKAQLMAAYKQQRDATLSALSKASEADFDRATGVDYAPTVGAMFSLHGSHWLMHCGQWAVVRRQLGRPPLF